MLVIRLIERNSFFWSTLGSSLDFVVVKRESYRMCLLLQSPPAMNFDPNVWKKVSNCSFFKLCRGGQ